MSFTLSTSNAPISIAKPSTCFKASVILLAPLPANCICFATFVIDSLVNPKVLALCAIATASSFENILPSNDFKVFIVSVMSDCETPKRRFFPASAKSFAIPAKSPSDNFLNCSAMNPRLNVAPFNSLLNFCEVTKLIFKFLLNSLVCLTLSRKEAATAVAATNIINNGFLDKTLTNNAACFFISFNRETLNPNTPSN